MRFEWDIYKAMANVAKHGIGFQQALTVFDDPYPVLIKDNAHSTESESRYQIIGECSPSLVGRTGYLLVVIFAVRESGILFRLISARKANRQERMLYEKYRP